MGREEPARAGRQRGLERHRQGQAPHGVGLRLLLEPHGQHPAVHAGLDQAGRDEPRGPAHRPGRVHPQQRLAGRAERVGQVQLGHHHALEQVGRLADHDGVDAGQGEPGGVKRTFLEDGDSLVMRGWCQGDGYRVGFGEVEGTILPEK